MIKELLKPILVRKLLTLVSLPLTGFWGRICIKLVEILIDKIIFPALDAMVDEGFLFIREKELKAKLKKYMEANTDEEFDEAFDNLIAGSKYRV